MIKILLYLHDWIFPEGLWKAKDKLYVIKNMANQPSIYAVTMEMNLMLHLKMISSATLLWLGQQHIRNMFDKEQEVKFDKTCS